MMTENFSDGKSSQNLKIELKAWYFPEGRIEWHLFSNKGKIWVPLDEQEAPTLDGKISFLEIEVSDFMINNYEERDISE